MIEAIQEKTVYIVEEHQKMIGSFMMQSIPKTFLIDVSPNALYLSKLMIKTDYQNQNYGKELIKHLQEWYKTKEVYCDCWAGNEKLIRFYSKNNCKRCGEFDENDYKIMIFQL